ncbi:MAG: hypothetical protein R3268_00255 [Acidiferrobacterales bacterium]|nr:hypothetical protein [Acidiferrobacterales bacterium]
MAMRIISQITGILIYLTIIVLTLGAWIQHFVTTVTEELWVLLVVGAIFPPVGVMHGWLIWAGVL